MRRALLVSVAALAVPLVLPSIAPAKPDREVTVMTRNIYLGADITRPIAATAGKTGLEALLAFGQANHVLRGIVDDTDFPARAVRLAEEIADTQPDLVGLQEVTMWRHGPMQLDQLGVANAEIVDYDFLAILLDALRAQGEHYTVVDDQVESDVEGPAFAALPGDPTSRDERLTISDVILRRVDTHNMKVLDSGGANFEARLGISIGGAAFEFIRGYVWADMKLRGRTFRFVTSHFESASSGIAAQQAGELVSGPAAPNGRPIVFVCDCNSNPLSSATRPPDPTPHWAAYRVITDGAGFADAWLEGGSGSGFTSGFNEFVNDPDTSGIVNRIDFVFSRPSLDLDDVTLVGVDPDNRTADGLWPSDHAGVVATFDLPN